MRSIVGRVLTDRFWQAGISEGSKDEFYARVLDRRNTLEGLASTIRGTVRFVRETCYAIIYCMSRLDVQFYGFSELPGPLAHSLFADSFCLSSHQIINLLNLVRYLVDHCPVELRAHFLPPILAACFQQMDAKITSEWENLGRQQGVQAAGDELTEEMKAESILRQLTYTAVVMVADFLDPQRQSTSERGVPYPLALFQTNNTLLDPPLSGISNGQATPSSQGKYPSLRRFCLMMSSIVEPLLLFCMHAIRMHDGRCCSVVLRVFRSIVPDFHDSDAVFNADRPPTERGHAQRDREFPIPEETSQAIREFISSDVMKACITSLHDPYFVESQKDLGSLIASVLVCYCPLTPTPRDVILSLPGIKPQDADQTIDYISRPGLQPRQQRALVLDLLKDLKGVSISEMGRLSKGMDARSKRIPRSKMAQEFMTAPAPATGPVGGGAEAGRKTPDLEGVASMFDEGV